MTDDTELAVDAAEGRDTVLSVQGLKKYYFERDTVLDTLLRREAQSVKAVDGISFDIEKGETLGVVGESGCGKSTTGETLLRLREATDGRVEFLGENIFDMDKGELKAFRRRAQIVFQDPFSSLDPRMTIGDILAEPLKIHDLPEEPPTGMSKADARREKAKDYLERVGLSAGQIDRYPHEFSGGQRQRIGIARALMLEPEFIVLDEPVSALDVSVQAQVLNLLDDLQEDFGLTYLFIAHDLSVVRHICDRVAVMYLGNVVEIGPTDELFENPKHPYTEALLESVPRATVEEQGRRVEPLPGDVPSPRNPPSGCRFRTRCPKVIPPADLDIDQTTFREVMNLRDRIESSDLSIEGIWDEVGENHGNKPAFKRHLREKFFTERLTGETETVVERALDALAEDERDQAGDILRSRFESVCEATRPVLQAEPHPAACHLYDQPPAEEAPPEPTADD